jgi:poly(hydroxyalkanoate) depolymerase family esterase
MQLQNLCSDHTLRAYLVSSTLVAPKMARPGLLSSPSLPSVRTQSYQSKYIENKFVRCSIHAYLSFLRPLSAKETDVVREQNARHLVEVTRFGTNPGDLKCWLYLPSILAPNASLVVVLHGCTQNARSYDHGSGWTQLAEERGFAVLFPEQHRFNNANLCFNWFEPGDTRRDAGEALSIREMIGHVVHSHGMALKRVFITGLSAGGAMANVMLAAYPEVFSGGAIIGGLPYGMASNVGQAFERMQGRNAPSARKLRSALTASSNAERWPKISVWHGTHDQTVKLINAEQTASQWLGAHGISETPDAVETVKGHIRKSWLDTNGVEAVEVYLIKGMAHGVPLSSGAQLALGNTGPFMLEAGISSTARIARTWGLADDNDVANAEGGVHPSAKQERPSHDLEAVIAKAMEYAKPKGAANNGNDKAADNNAVSKVINDALRAAGLMR